MIDFALKLRSELGTEKKCYEGFGSIMLIKPNLVYIYHFPTVSASKAIPSVFKLTEKL